MYDSLHIIIILVFRHSKSLAADRTDLLRRLHYRLGYRIMTPHRTLDNTVGGVGGQNGIQKNFGQIWLKVRDQFGIFFWGVFRHKTENLFGIFTVFHGSLENVFGKLYLYLYIIYNISITYGTRAWESSSD